METEADKASAVNTSTGDVISKVPLNSLKPTRPTVSAAIKILKAR